MNKTNNGLTSTYIASTMSIPYDRYMNTTGKISMTNNGYQNTSVSKTFKFKYNDTSVVKN